MRVIVTLEAEAEKVKALIEHLFQHHPDAQVNVNPQTAPTITVSGNIHPASATPTGGHGPGGPGGGK